jgi:hypothetical protein
MKLQVLSNLLIPDNYQHFKEDSVHWDEPHYGDKIEDDEISETCHIHGKVVTQNFSQSVSLKKRDHLGTTAYIKKTKPRGFGPLA